MSAPINRSTWLPILEAYRPQLHLSLLRMIDHCVGTDCDCDDDFNDVATTVAAFMAWYKQDKELPELVFPEVPYGHLDIGNYLRAMVYEVAAQFVQASVKWQKGEPSLLLPLGAEYA